MAKTDFGTHSLSSHTVILTPGRHTQTFPISNLSLSNLIFISHPLSVSLSSMLANSLFINSLPSLRSFCFYLLFPFFCSLSLPLFSSPLSLHLLQKQQAVCLPWNEATNGKYANENSAAGLEWDTIYPKSWLSIMARD